MTTRVTKAQKNLIVMRPKNTTFSISSIDNSKNTRSKVGVFIYEYYRELDYINPIH